MGNPIYKLKCKDCNHREEIFFGFTYNGDLVKPYYCTNCKKIKTRIIKDDKHSDIQPQICNKCGKDLSELIIDMPNSQLNSDLTKTPTTVTPQVHCPKCKSENVEVFFSGLWD